LQKKTKGEEGWAILGGGRFWVRCLLKLVLAQTGAGRKKKEKGNGRVKGSEKDRMVFFRRQAVGFSCDGFSHFQRKGGKPGAERGKKQGEEGEVKKGKSRAGLTGHGGVLMSWPADR